VSGRLAVVGIGPGDARWLTPEAERALAAADALYGYGPYLDRVPARPGQARHASGNREEGARAAAALRHAAEGQMSDVRCQRSEVAGRRSEDKGQLSEDGGSDLRSPTSDLRHPTSDIRPPTSGCNVALVCGGDPGVFAMAAAVCAEIEAGPEGWRRLEVTIVPGITAMLAVAARAGAPLGHDFCALSLSDNLKPWDVIERRLDAAAAAGFAIALYNPVSRARPWQLGAAFDRLARHLPASCPVVFGRAVGRADEDVQTTTLAGAKRAAADMATLVIVGTADTRVVTREGLPPLVYTPRSEDRQRMTEDR
jgi:precorrin-3B C17-methyltransferase